MNDSLVSIEDLTETAPVSDWAEEKYCLFHPIDCLSALSVKDRELQWEQDMASDGFWERKSGYNGLGDAARHVYLGCMLAERFGGKFAAGLLNAHEEDSSAVFGFGKRRAGNKCCEKIMDSYNHHIGIDLAGEHGNCEKNVLNSLSKTRHTLCEEGK